MKNPLCCAFTFFASLLIPASAIPQTGTPTHAPDGGARERLTSVTILPKPGAPFSATVATEWTRLLEDGTTTTIRNHRFVARDSTGRIFEERRFLNPKGDKQETPLSALQYSDPNRHEFYNCNPYKKVCFVSGYNAPATVPAAMASGDRLPNGAGTVTREALGQQRIANLEATGSREITTINPGANGYQRPEPTIKEFWYSPRLEVNLVVKRFEPRGGAENFTLTSINLSEPDPKLFVPPADYKIVRTNPE